MGYKLAPDWYWLENANLSGKEEYFLSLEIAKEESEKYRKEALANGNEYKENIFPDVRCLPLGKYFIGDPVNLINDYEDDEKWPVEANDVFVSDDGTYFALFHADLGPGKYLDEDGNEFPKVSGDIIIIQFEKIDKIAAEILAEDGLGYIFESKFALDVGKDRQFDGSIDYGGFPEIDTSEKIGLNDEDQKIRPVSNNAFSDVLIN